MNEMTRVSLSLPDRVEIEALLTEFSWLIDNGQADRIAALFTEDGQVRGLGTDLIGRKAIDAHFVRRAQERGKTTRHLWTNFRLVEVQVDRVVSTVNVITYIRHGDPGSPCGVMVGDSCDVFRKSQNDKWRFLERALNVVFPPSMSGPAPEATNHQRTANKV